MMKEEEIPADHLTQQSPEKIIQMLKVLFTQR